MSVMDLPYGLLSPIIAVKKTAITAVMLQGNLDCNGKVSIHNCNAWPKMAMPVVFLYSSIFYFRSFHYQVCWILKSGCILYSVFSFCCGYLRWNLSLGILQRQNFCFLLPT